MRLLQIIHDNTQRLDRMVQDAEIHASEDAAQKERAEKHNALDSMIYQAEKMLGENEDKLADADKASVRSAVEDAKKDLESGDVAKIDAARQRVEQELHKVAEALYKAQTAEGEAGTGTAGAGGAPAGDEGEVVDAEYIHQVLAEFKGSAAHLMRPSQQSLVIGKELRVVMPDHGYA